MKLLVWDFDGTLAYRGGWTGTLCEILSERNPSLGERREEIRGQLQNGFPWHRPEVVRQATLGADDWWDALIPLFTRAFRAAGVMSPLDKSYAGEVRKRYCDPAAWLVFPDCAPTLEKLTEAGWTHVILSNHVPELAGLVGDLGLSKHFHRITSSGVSGYEKPNPLSYASAVSGFDDVREVWMVGDSYDADVAGPIRQGWKAILVRKSNPKAEHFAQDLTRVAALLGTPNQALEPMPLASTPRACARVAPAKGMAHL